MYQAKELSEDTSTNKLSITRNQISPDDYQLEDTIVTQNRIYPGDCQLQNATVVQNQISPGKNILENATVTSIAYTLIYDFHLLN